MKDLRKRSISAIEISGQTNHYLIKGGKLLVRSVGKTSWADSRFDNNTIANIDQTRRFLKDVIDALKTDGIK
jgi:hypothetical protein